MRFSGTLFLILFCTSLQAQTPRLPGIDVQVPGVEFTDAQIKDAMISMLKGIQDSDCGGQKCAPATEAELSQPILSLQQAGAAMRTGVISGTAEWCGLDWLRLYFGPMMFRLVREGKLDQRQQALLIMLHGIYRNRFAKSLPTLKGKCSEGEKADLRSLAGTP